MKTFLLLIIFASLLVARDNFKSAQTCRECHEEIVMQWEKSVHANATPERDPLFAGMYDWAVKDSKGKLKKKCIVCHSPLSAVFGSILPQEPYNREGVTCQFCHGAAAIKGFHSARDIQVELDTVYSYQPEKDNDAHPAAHREYYRKSDLCLPCHASMTSPRRLEVCATGSEWRDHFDRHGKSCQDCHMPEKDGVPSHLFPGTHRGELLKGAVKMEVEYNGKDETLGITLTNVGAGHALPTGTPLRMVILKVRGFDKAGIPRWENWKTNPIKEDTSALFMKILADSEGKGPVPPWKATQVLFDRRLMPGEPARISYNLSGKNLNKLEVTLLYRFAPAPVLRKFEIFDPRFTEPRVMVRKEIKINN